MCERYIPRRPYGVASYSPDSLLQRSSEQSIPRIYVAQNCAHPQEYRNTLTSYCRSCHTAKITPTLKEEAEFKFLTDSVNVIGIISDFTEYKRPSLHVSLSRLYQLSSGVPPCPTLNRFHFSLQCL